MEFLEAIGKWILANIMPLLNLLAIGAISIFGKKWIDERNQEIKSLYSKKEIIYRMKVQREFEIYRHLWKKLIALRESTLHLSKYLTYVGVDTKTGETIDIRSENLEDLFKVLNEAKRYINDNIPFYDKIIYKLSEALTKTPKEFNNLRSLSLIDPEAGKILSQGLNEMNSLIGQIEKAIREKFESYE